MLAFLDSPHPRPGTYPSPQPPTLNPSIPRITVQRFPLKAAHLLLTHLSDRTIIPCVRSNTNSHNQRRNQKPREAPRPDPEDVTPETSGMPSPHPTGPVTLPHPSTRWKVHNIKRHGPHIGALPKNLGPYGPWKNLPRRSPRRFPLTQRRQRENTSPPLRVGQEN